MSLKVTVGSTAPLTLMEGTFTLQAVGLIVHACVISHNRNKMSQWNLHIDSTDYSLEPSVFLVTWNNNPF